MVEVIIREEDFIIIVGEGILLIEGVMFRGGGEVDIDRIIFDEIM